MLCDGVADKIPPSKANGLSEIWAVCLFVAYPPASFLAAIKICLTLTLLGGELVEICLPSIHPVPATVI